MRVSFAVLIVALTLPFAAAAQTVVPSASPQQQVQPRPTAQPSAAQQQAAQQSAQQRAQPQGRRVIRTPEQRLQEYENKGGRSRQPQGLYTRRMPNLPY